MPFTPAHAAAAIPFQRTRLIPSALVIGCFSPDFEYFLRLGPRGDDFGHSLAGLFVFDLPLAILTLWLFHTYATEPVLAWLPAGIRRRLPSSTALQSMRSARGIALVLLSILVGEATHILWDSFTHAGYWPYRHWHFLSRTMELPLVGQVEYVKVLQHVSSVAGLVVLLVWFWHWYRHTVPSRSLRMERPGKDDRVLLAVLCIAAAGAALLRGFLGFNMPITPHECEVLLAEAVTTAVTVLWLEILAYGFLRAQRRARLKNVRWTELH